MIRPGHHRPIGTTTWMRFRHEHWDRPGAPRLGDVAYQITAQGSDDPDRVRRCYIVVGVEDNPTCYRLLLERAEYGTVPDPGDRHADIWSFFNVPRAT